MPATSLGNYMRAMAELKNAGEWALPYMGAAAASGPAYLVGAMQYGSSPRPIADYRRGGFPAMAEGYRQAVQNVPGGELSVAAMEGAEDFARSRGASVPAMLAADIAAPDPMAKLGALATAAKGIGGLAAIPAFVGSPHRWKPNKRLGRLTTDWDMINTGEGSQMKGYGHYSADLEDVAQNYVAGVNDLDVSLIDGKPWIEGYNFDDFLDSLPPEDLKTDGVSPIWSEMMADVDARGVEAQKRLLRRNLDEGKGWGDQPARWKAQLEFLEKHGDRITDGRRDPIIYGVLHDVNPEDLLDLDAPLSQQSPKVRGAMQQFFKQDEYDLYGRFPGSGGPGGDEWFLISDMFEGSVDDLTGNDALELLAGPYGLGDPANAEALTDALREAGIPGNMFFDGFSRGAGEGTRNYVMFGDDLTYVDPARTDPELIGGLEVGKPWRTVDGAGPARVKTWTPAEQAAEQARQRGIGGLSQDAQLAGQANMTPGVVEIAPGMDDFSRRQTVFHEQAHDAMRRVPREVRDAFYDWFNSEPSWSPYNRAYLGVRPDDPMSNPAGVNVDEFLADAYANIDPYREAMIPTELDPAIGTGMELTPVPKPLRDILVALDNELGGMWQRRSRRAARRAGEVEVDPRLGGLSVGAPYRTVD